MDKLLNDINAKIEYLQNKFKKTKDSIVNHSIISDDEKWTQEDAYFLSDLLEVSKYLYNICYNSVLEQMKKDDNSVVEKYCNEKKENISKEIYKHKSKYVLKELKEELTVLDRIISGKERFIDSNKKYNTNLETLANNLTKNRSTAVGEQMSHVYFDKELNPSYKVVLDDMLNGNFKNYNQLGVLNNIKTVLYDLEQLKSNMWEVNNLVDNILYNPINVNKDDNTFRKISQYVSSFIKYKEYLQKFGIEFPRNNLGDDYYKNVETFLKTVSEKDVISHIMNSQNELYDNIKQQLPKEYLDISYGFFGTSSGKPGVAYYFDEPGRLQEAKNMKYIYDVLKEAQLLEGKQISNEITNAVEQKVEHSVDEMTSRVRI